MAQPFKTTPCKGCGKPIVWAVSIETGKPIPLDPKPATYLVWQNSQGVAFCERSLPCSTEHGNDWPTMVTHFATCPEGNRFSGSKKKAAP